MSKMSVVEFIESTLELPLHVLSDKGWYRCNCPIHGETRPSFGILTVWPYFAKCFSCAFKDSLAGLTAKLLKISRERAAELIQSKVDIKLEVREPYKRKVTSVPDAIVEMYEECFDQSLGEKYMKYRGVPKYLSKLWQLGYADLERSLVIPLRNTETGNIQSYTSVQFQGSFDEVFKSKPADAGSGVTVPSNYKSFTNALVVEGYIDGMKAAEVMWKMGMDVVPVALNTAFPTKEQMRFIRRFERVIIGLDHDESGRKGFEHIRRQLRDKAYVYELIYDEHLKDPGQLTAESVVATKLLF